MAFWKFVKNDEKTPKTVKKPPFDVFGKFMFVPRYNGPDDFETRLYDE